MHDAESGEISETILSCSAVWGTPSNAKCSDFSPSRAEQALLQVSADRASSQRVTGRCRYLPVFGIGRWKIGNCAVCSCIFSGTTVRRSRRLSGFMARTLPSAQARLRKVRVSSSSWPSWPSSRENEGFGAGTTGEQRQRHARKQNHPNPTLCVGRCPTAPPPHSARSRSSQPGTSRVKVSADEPTTAPGRLCALVQLCIPLHRSTAKSATLNAQPPTKTSAPHPAPARSLLIRTHDIPAPFPIISITTTSPLLTTTSTHPLQSQVVLESDSRNLLESLRAADPQNQPRT